MTAAAVLPPRLSSPLPDVAPAPPGAAVSYQRVLHQLARRELRLLADLASWAPSDEAARTVELTRHADLVSRVLLQHHAVERDVLWPALFRLLPRDEQEAARHYVTDWTSRTALLDHHLRDLSTVARQWAVSESSAAREAFVVACSRLADAVEAQTEAEEMTLLPLIGTYLTTADWRAVSRAARTDLDGREQMLVLGLALEDACAGDRARLLAGLSPAARTAWRLFGHRDYRAAVVRLRGAPPAA